MTRTLPTAAFVVAAATLTLAGCSGDRDASTVRVVTTPTTAVSTPDSTSPTSTTPITSPSGPARFSSAGSSRLRFFAECPDLLAYMQTEALQRVTAWGLGGGPWYGYRGGPLMESAAATADSAAGAPPIAPGAPSAPAGTAAPNFSGTNTQEEGVDEGDIVETDGTHVFVASQDGVRIVDVAGALVMSKLDLPDGSHQLLLDGTRLLVTTQPYSGIDTVVSLFDVSDVSAPALLHRSHLEGYLVASRSVDGTARLVLTSSMATRLPFVNPGQFGLDEDRALQRNKDIITQSTVDDWMPRAFDESSDGTFGDISTTLDCSAVAAPSQFAGLGVSWIASIDMQGSGEPVGSAGVVSTGETVYASTTSIYLATMPWDWYQPTDVVDRTPTPPPTLIHKFSLGANGTASYEASGEVPGQLLNQFSMSEYEGDLRVATTTTSWDGTTPSTSAVRVLRPAGNELTQIGIVDGLGTTEQIYAVRFLGTQAYVVTFRQTDPLYVVDLSDPAAPALSGELKIPGYSSYSHPVGDGLLLGVGQAGTDDGRIQGTQLSLFDVHDPANPVQLSTLAIGGFSEAEWDHHAFLYWPEDGTIVLPSSPGWNNCGIAVDCLASGITNPAGGVVVAQLEGTTLVGRGTISSQGHIDGGCWNPLQRSLAIGSELVTVGMADMQFSDRASLATRDSVS
ncbi:MAG TPA: beta-propeller domain-containing protein, partial [Ilumatobacteraceae bacterium]|nr:beta-propeller domain-containing protein [Ilumatobacteraceae bacterium]